MNIVGQLGPDLDPLRELRQNVTAEHILRQLDSDLRIRMLHGQLECFILLCVAVRFQLCLQRLLRVFVEFQVAAHTASLELETKRGARHLLLRHCLTNLSQLGDETLLRRLLQHFVLSQLQNGVGKSNQAFLALEEVGSHNEDGQIQRHNSRHQGSK